MSHLQRALLIALLVSLGVTVTAVFMHRAASRNAAGGDGVLHVGNEPLPELYPIGEFSFPDALGRATSPADLRGRVWVASIFFGSCKSICPGVVGQLINLHSTVTDPRVRIITFTLDPARDTPEKLQEYAKAIDADPDRWRFVRAPDQETIFRFSREQLKLAVEPTGDPDDISHSGQFLLVDGRGIVRGIYDYNDPDEMKQLAADATELAAQTGK